MVYMRVGIENRLYRIVSHILLQQFKRCLRTLYRHQGIIDNPAGVSLDKGDIGHIISPDLIDPVHHFKQSVDMIQLRVPPQAGICAVRRILIQKCVSILTPCHLSGVCFDLQAVRCRDQAALCIFQFPFVIKVQQRVNLLIRVNCILRRLLRIRIQVGAFFRHCCA